MKTLLCLGIFVFAISSQAFSASLNCSSFLKSFGEGSLMTSSCGNVRLDVPASENEVTLALAGNGCGKSELKVIGLMDGRHKLMVLISNPKIDRGLIGKTSSTISDIESGFKVEFEGQNSYGSDVIFELDCKK